MAHPSTVMARLVRATSRGRVLVRMARTSRAMTVEGWAAAITRVAGLILVNVSPAGP